MVRDVDNGVRPSGERFSALFEARSGNLKWSPKDVGVRSHDVSGSNGCVVVGPSCTKEEGGGRRTDVLSCQTTETHDPDRNASPHTAGGKKIAHEVRLLWVRFMMRNEYIWCYAMLFVFGLVYELLMSSARPESPRTPRSIQIHHKEHSRYEDSTTVTTANDNL